MYSYNVLVFSFTKIPFDVKKDLMAEVTIKDIARECGISFSAVSKALKGSPEISAATIELVQETAKKMGYRANAAARKLRTKRSYDIGVIFEDATGSGLQHQYFASIFDALNISANQKGYNISFLNSVNRRQESYLSQAKYRGFDGVVVASTNDFLRSDIQELIHSDIPCCLLDYTSEKDCSSVLSDNENGIRQIIDYLISMGHKKIAYVYGDTSDVTNVRLEAFYDEMAVHNLSVPKEYVIKGIYHEPKSSESATRSLLALKNPPSCILYPDDFAYLGGMKALMEKNLIPGRDISVVGYDGIFLSSVLSPVLTTYSQNAKEIGNQLASLLIQRIENPALDFQIVRVKGQLREGQTVCRLLSSGDRHKFTNF